ncbi:hypothetical protein N7447_006683 [Penicillium robsamsonii]|uniref:uncharacterized protein n=1 Tax=Penicillium robsamsonii TaxID=1792511 RepID=UPI0025484EF3|nr:uncharacterized protein N7447_006683 [Penicillium robsamsonii]KAJ5824343.1 hypothetical protein N7447_006683 [Penicillium robsamsonii]
MVKLLLDGIPTKADTFDDMKSGLESAAGRDDLKMFQLLKEYGSELGDKCFNALDHAIYEGCHIVVKHLLAQQPAGCSKEG